MVERFSRDRKVFASPDYKEEQLRLEFLNPFFTALGWGMDIPLTLFVLGIGEVSLFFRDDANDGSRLAAYG